MSPSSPDPVRLDDLPNLPRDTDGPVFEEPWQAQAFALTLSLHQAGLFAWSEWAEQLSQTLAEARQAGDPDRGDTYYQHWLTALERIILKKNIISADQLHILRNLWDETARATPHGQPIVLPHGWQETTGLKP